MSVKSVCVFCGAQNAVPKHFLDMGSYFGEQLAKQSLKLVYGGGDCGLMGATANATMANGGHVTGVFPISLRSLENEHKSLSEIVIVGSMHERKKLMFDMSDAFVVLPGGFGTMDELFEILTWKQLKLHDKPIIIVNYENYWAPLVTLMENIMLTGFAKRENAQLYKVVETPDEAIAALS